jgi:hypothetical protein
MPNLFLTFQVAGHKNKYNSWNPAIAKIVPVIGSVPIPITVTQIRPTLIWALNINLSPNLVY